MLIAKRCLDCNAILTYEYALSEVCDNEVFTINYLTPVRVISLYFYTYY